MAEVVGRQLSARKKTDWSTQPTDTFAGDITALNCRRYYSVEEGTFRSQEPSDPRWWLSEGFSICTGIVMRTKGGRFTLAHMIPLLEDGFIRHLDAICETKESRHAVLVYGTLSSKPRKFVRHARKGRWGSCSFSTIKVETKRSSWALALDTKTGLIRVVRRTPDQTIFDYQPSW